MNYVIKITCFIDNFFYFDGVQEEGTRDHVKKTQFPFDIKFISKTFHFSQSRVAPGAAGSCEGVYCRAGRECVLTSSPVAAACVCVKECPDHWKPVSQYF